MSWKEWPQSKYKVSDFFQCQAIYPLELSSKARKRINLGSYIIDRHYGYALNVLHILIMEVGFRFAGIG